MVITVELNAEQTLALQRAQYRNGEELSHTLLRLAGLVPEPTPNEMSVYDLMSAQAQEELYRQEDARLLAAIEEWASIERGEHLTRPFPDEPHDDEATEEAPLHSSREQGHE